MKKLYFMIVNIFVTLSILANQASEQEIFNQLEVSKQTNKFLAILMLLLIWLVYRYRARHISENKKKEVLHNLVYYHEITKISNKNKYYLDKEKNLFENFQGSFISLIIDNISRFYELHDHNLVGKMLKDLSDIIQKKSEIAHLYHYDSGAFIIFLKNKDENFSKEFCKALSADVALTMKEGVSLSFGIHGLSKDENLNEIYRLTRVASRLAKRFSFEKILLANHEEIEKYQDSLKIEEDIPRGLLHSEFIPYFQPKVNLDTEEVVGAEALIRWQHFSGEMIYPDRFICIAEESNIIIYLDLMVAEKSIEMAKKWIDEGSVKKDFKLSFNLSSKTFISPGIIPKLVNILTKYNYNPANLEIELTETIVISDFEHFSNIIEELSNLGINISLDDFTAGFSSTEYLTKLKIDSVKLDRALILGTEKDDENGKKKRGMYKMLVQMIDQLGLTVISEGLDDERHLVLIKESGVKIGQGYYFSTPLEEIKFLEYVKQQNVN